MNPALEADNVQYFPRNLTVGVVANEFFSQDVGRMGGFGWSTGLLAQVFRRRSDLGVELIFIFASPSQRGDKENAYKEGEVQLHSWPLINLLNRDVRWGGTISTRWTNYYLRRRRIDVFLFIDFRDDYRQAHDALPSVPVRRQCFVP